MGVIPFCATSAVFLPCLNRTSPNSVFLGANADEISWLFFNSPTRIPLRKAASNLSSVERVHIHFVFMFMFLIVCAYVIEVSKGNKEV